MRDTGIANTSVQDYMLIWLGIVGASVGLNVSSTDLCRA
jgi:ubiquitin-like-conjugating enzyme ATG10